MPRKSRSYDKHVPEPDPKYGSVKYAKFINYIMERGKKNVARKIFYDALKIVEEKAGGQFLNSSAAPQIKMVQGKAAAAPKSADDKNPIPAKTPEPSQNVLKNQDTNNQKSASKPLDGRQIFDIALKNVSPMMELKSRRIGGANYQVPMEERLATEIMDAYNKTGAAMKKREDTHRMAEANKAFAHFARFGRR
jgi:small subunit ribosomal protein S7